jgi:hypothetical protein
MHGQASTQCQVERIPTQPLSVAPLTATRTENTDDDYSPVG